MKEHVICPICAEKASVKRTGGISPGHIKCDGPNGCGHYATLSKANLARLDNAGLMPPAEPTQNDPTPPAPEAKKKSGSIIDDLI